MDPILIDTDVLGSHLTVESYAFFMGLAAVAVMLVSWFVLARLHLPVRSGLGILAVSMLAIPVGARLLAVVSRPEYYLDNPDQVLTRELVGFSLMGGLLLALAVGLVACRRLGVAPWRLADAVTPGLFVGSGRDEGRLLPRRLLLRGREHAAVGGSVPVRQPGLPAGSRAARPTLRSACSAS